MVELTASHKLIANIQRTVDDCRIIKLPIIPDVRGNLSVIENQRHISFEIQRAYWIYDVPGGELRVGHAYREACEFIVALSGSFDVVLNDGKQEKIVSLNRSFFGLYVPNLIWRQLENFSTNALCMILSSSIYSAEDYVRDYQQFLRLQGVIEP